MRSKQAKPSKFTGKYRQYSKERMLRAYEEVKVNGTSVRMASAIYDVPYATLVDRVAKRVQNDSMKNEEPLFTKEQELSIVEFLETFAQLGYSVSSSKIRYVTGDYAFQLGKRPSIKMLSCNWHKHFVKRWESRISPLRPNLLETSRTKSSTQDIVNKYFTNLQKVMEENDLLNKPHFIYNLDETVVHTKYNKPAVIAVPLHENPQEETLPHLTTTIVIGCVNAIGQSIPPYFIFKGKKQHSDLMLESLPGTSYTTSETGWSSSQVFRDYLENHFLPNVNLAENGTSDNQPIILIFDGHTNHMSKSLLEWAVSKNIILVMLPAYTSHVLQPLDVAVFKSFKKCFYQECETHMGDLTEQSLTQQSIIDIACKTFIKAASPDIIVSAFKTTGIYPIDSAVIDYTTLFHDEARGKKPKRSSASEKEITGDTCLGKVDAYDDDDSETVRKQTIKQKQTTGTSRQSKKKKKNVSPRSSTSSDQIRHGTNIQSDTSDEEMGKESGVCCVCEQYSPPADKKPHLKIVNWAQCDNCNHSIHLSFCHDKKAIRRMEKFLCPHCV